MNSEEKQVFIQKYGFDPGTCECEIDEKEENMVEITECHAALLDKFVEHAEAQHTYIVDRERYVAEMEMKLSLLDPSLLVADVNTLGDGLKKEDMDG